MSVTPVAGGVMFLSYPAVFSVLVNIISYANINYYGLGFENERIRIRLSEAKVCVVSCMFFSYEHLPAAAEC